MTIKPQSPSIETSRLTWVLILKQKTAALRETLLARAQRKLRQAQDAADAAQGRLDCSARQDLEYEADELRAVIGDCNKAKAQAEDRLTSILNYLDPDEVYTARPQVPEGAGLDVPAEPIVDVPIVDAYDAPAGYKAVQDYGISCSHCAFSTDRARCPKSAAGGLRCAYYNRLDGVEVVFIKRD